MVADDIRDLTNMVGHNSNVGYAANWTRSFMNEVLGNPNFDNNTCVLITFDENEHYPEENRVFSLLLGSAISGNLRGSGDLTFYTHYSQLSTIQAALLLIQVA